MFIEIIRPDSRYLADMESGTNIEVYGSSGEYSFCINCGKTGSLCSNNALDNVPFFEALALYDRVKNSWVKGREVMTINNR